MKTVGILGGGQLALMLGQAAIRLGVRPLIMAESELMPAAHFFKDPIIGSLKEKRKVLSFLKQSDFIIFESENIDLSPIEEVVASHKEYSNLFFPKIKVIKLLQSKLRQKKLFEKLGIPTSPFKIIPNKSLKQITTTGSEAFYIRFIHELRERFPMGIVFKWATQGYDGKGVCILGPKEPLTTKHKVFFQEAYKRKIELYVESLIPYQKECAMIAVKSKKEFITYPLVFSKQVQGVCEQVKGPAVQLGIDQSVEKSTEETLKLIAEKTDLEGTFGAEFFQINSGELFINELAPRVHNSGHYTQNACQTDQFENHLRALFNLPLGLPRTLGLFGMQNVLGPRYRDNFEGHVHPLTAPILPSSNNVHWYSKDSVSPGRKMGHINVLLPYHLLPTPLSRDVADAMLSKSLDEIQKVLNNHW